MCDSCYRTSIFSDSLLHSHSLHHSIVSLVLIYMRGGAIRLVWRCSVMQPVSVGSLSVVGGSVLLFSGRAWVVSDITLSLYAVGSDLDL